VQIGGLIRAASLTYDDIGVVKVVHEEYGDDPRLFGPSREVKTEIMGVGGTLNTPNNVPENVSSTRRPTAKIHPATP